MWEQSFQISDEEYERLKKISDLDIPFSDIKEVKDVYERLYTIVIEEETQRLLEDDEIAEKYGDIDGWSAEELYEYGIYMPDFL